MMHLRSLISGVGTHQPFYTFRFFPNMICTVDIGMHNGVVVIESLIQCDLIARINSLRLEYHGLQFMLPK